MSSSARYRQCVLPCAALLMMILVQSCGLPAAKTRPAFAGRLLLVGDKRDGGRTVFQIEQDSDVPQELWSFLPGQPGSTWDLTASPDARYVIQQRPDLSIAVLDLSTGEFGAISLPARSYDVSFSPDSSHLTYEFAEGSSHNLYLMDVAADEAIVLFTSPCADYASGGMTCGDIAEPAWIDQSTLSFDAYVGVMPFTVTMPGYPELKPNHTFVMTVKGALVHEFDQALGILPGKGSTVIIQQENGWAWLEAGDLTLGTFSPNPLSESPGIPNLSPDGRYAIHRVDLEHVLVELRTSTSTPISDVYADPVWSPDGKYLASIRGLHPDRELYIISLDGSERLVLELDQIFEEITPFTGWDWSLLSWLP